MTAFQRVADPRGPFDVASRTISASNRPRDEAEILIMRVADGKIGESWAAWNRLGVLNNSGSMTLALASAQTLTDDSPGSDQAAVLRAALAGVAPRSVYHLIESEH